MLTLDDIWLRLTTQDIGFFTYRRRDKIPSLPGVYAWFHPLRLRTDPKDIMSLSRKLAAYDAGCLGVAKWTSSGAGFRWDPLTVEIARNSSVEFQGAKARNWKALSTADGGIKATFSQALFVSTIFSRPLYVGLARNLSKRYQDHLVGQEHKNDFHHRFTNYMRDLNEPLTIEQLLFVCIPLRSHATNTDDMTDEQISLLEDILKVTCQPVFDDR